MVHETACRSIRITICLLLVCTTLGSAQSGTHTQQNPRGVTVVPAAPTASPTERRVADAMIKALFPMKKDKEAAALLPLWCLWLACAGCVAGLCGWRWGSGQLLQPPEDLGSGG